MFECKCYVFIYMYVHMYVNFNLKYFTRKWYTATHFSKHLDIFLESTKFTWLKYNASVVILCNNNKNLQTLQCTHVKCVYGKLSNNNNFHITTTNFEIIKAFCIMKKKNMNGDEV